MQGENILLNLVCLVSNAVLLISEIMSEQHFFYLSISHTHRVLFTAEFPHTVVHVNAAYGTLVKKELASPCALGRPMTTANGIGNSSSSTHQEMSTLKEETVSKLITNHLGISKESITYHLFPVISDDKSFCNFVRSYQKHDYSTHPFLKNELGKKEEHEDRYSAKHSHVSHYLLQIEPVAQFTSQLNRL